MHHILWFLWLKMSQLNVSTANNVICGVVVFEYWEVQRSNTF